jgi:hypothetical protein
VPKFGRKYILTIFPAYNVTKDRTLTPSTEDPIQVTDPITLEFNVRRMFTTSSGSSVFRLYNLSKDKRNRIVKSELDTAHFRKVTLQAGYEYPLPIIFSGNIKKAYSFKEEGSTNFITQIEASDFGFAMSTCFSNFTLNNVSKNDIIDKLVNDMKNGYVDRGIVTDYTETGCRASVCGSTWEKLCSETSDNCFIDNGKVNILKDDEVFEGSIPELSADTGLLATPKMDGLILTADMLFEPGLVIGQLIKLNSQTASQINGQSFNADYRINGIIHQGVISGAVNGKCKTTATLFSGMRIFNIINT